MATPPEPTSPRELVLRLGRHPQVVGIVEYGTRRYDDAHADGDLDLVVILDAADPGTGTLHGWIGPVPVDLGIVTAQHLTTTRELVGWERVLLEGRVVLDTDGRAATMLDRLRRAPQGDRGPSASEVAGMRHGARHARLKAEAAAAREDWVLASLLATSTAAWLVQHWFTVRGRDYPGERRALAVLRAEEPPAHAALETTLVAPDPRATIAACERLAQLALAPVGGPWGDDEVIARAPRAGAPAADRVWRCLLEGQPVPAPTA